MSDYVSESDFDMQKVHFCSVIDTDFKEKYEILSAFWARNVVIEDCFIEIQDGSVNFCFARHNQHLQDRFDYINKLINGITSE